MYNQKEVMKKASIKIKDIIRKYCCMCKINDCYFTVDTDVLANGIGGRIEFGMGPSPYVEDKWTMKKLHDVQEAFYKEIQDVLKETEYEGVRINSSYGISSTWAVCGYELQYFNTDKI